VRLDDAARLAGRIAHDFDNVLMGVMGYAELAQAHLEADSPPANYLAEVLKVAADALVITRQLHQLNRSVRADGRSARLDQIFDRRALVASAQGMRLDLDLPADLPAIVAAVEPIRAVLHQLIRNAAEAMCAGGSVTVSARFIESDHGIPDTLPKPLPAGGYVSVTVADNGSGIRPDLLTRVGRVPFVTTKPRGRGLGLPIVVRTLGALGGGVRIDSSPKGTAVHVYLPSEDPAPPAPGRNVARAAPLEVVPS
jgi:signal transduction histidine kinase